MLRQWLRISVSWLWVTSLAWADILCIEKATGRDLEYQSAARPGICQQNWVTDNPQYGYTADQIEERIVTATEYEAQVARPRREAEALIEAGRRATRQSRADAIRQKLGLTVQEFQDLQASMR